MTQVTDKVHRASSAKDSMLLCWNWPFTLLWTCWGPNAVSEAEFTDLDDCRQAC